MRFEFHPTNHPLLLFHLFPSLLRGVQPSQLRLLEQVERLIETYPCVDLDGLIQVARLPHLLRGDALVELLLCEERVHLDVPVNAAHLLLYLG